jgi:hypothetical protein
MLSGVPAGMFDQLEAEMVSRIKERDDDFSRCLIGIHHAR